MYIIHWTKKSYIGQLDCLKRVIENPVDPILLKTRAYRFNPQMIIPLGIYINSSPHKQSLWLSHTYMLKYKKVENDRDNAKLTCCLFDLRHRFIFTSEVRCFSPRFTYLRYLNRINRILFLWVSKFLNPALLILFWLCP